MEQESIFDILRKAELNYIHGTSQIGTYVNFQMHEVIEKITAYLNSKHISGEKDSLGREKPFFNIVTAAVNIWYRATDIGRKDIIVRPDKKKNTLGAFFATQLLQVWMRKSRFGVFLKQWGRALAQYGSTVIKFVEKDGELMASVIPWNRLIVDPIDFNAQPVIEKFYKTPAQLLQSEEYDQKVIESLISAVSARKTLDGQQKDSQSDFVEIYEIHGLLPLALLKDNPKDADWKIFRQQIHVVSYVKNKEGKYEDFCLYKGKEAKSPYLLTHLIEEEGRTLSIGAVESLFDAQWMQNHTIKNMKDTLDLSSKLLFQTADTSYVGRNVLSAIETGDILIHKENLPLTQVNNSKQDIVALQNFSNQWKVLGQELTATPDAMRGVTPPSGTPYSTTALLTGQSSSLFEIMTENKGLAIEEMLRTFVIPHLKKKMDNKDEIATLLSDNDLKQIDALYVPFKAIERHNKQFVNDVLENRQPMPFNKISMGQQIKEELTPMGNQRFINPKNLTWKEVLKDLEWELEVGVTNESVDKQAMATTLTSLLQVLAQPNIQQNPTVMTIIGKILNLAGGISPVEISSIQATPQLTTIQPQIQ